MKNIFTFKNLSSNYDYLAPDSSEIRLLPSMDAGGLCHCTLSVGKTSAAVKHKTVSEIWYCLSGNGEIWQSNDSTSEVRAFHHGHSLTIPVGNSFQFRNTGNEPLCILIATMPP
jgi:mannose-6-phosphate isomerase-like protein (cupin superfamily)